MKRGKNRRFAHIICITNDGAGKREDGVMKQYGESLEAQCFPCF